MKPGKAPIFACLLNRPFVSPGCAYYNKASDNIHILFSFHQVISVSQILVTTVTLTRTTAAAASSKQDNYSLFSSSQQLKRKNPPHVSLSSPCSCYHHAWEYSSSFRGTPVAWRPPQMMGWEWGQGPWVPSQLELLFRSGSDSFPQSGSTCPTGKASRKAALTSGSHISSSWQPEPHVSPYCLGRANENSPAETKRCCRVP